MNALFKYALIIEYQVLKAIVFHLLYSDKLLGVACHARSKHNNGLQIKNGRPTLCGAAGRVPLAGTLRTIHPPSLALRLRRINWAPARGAPTLFRLNHLLRCTVRRCFQLVVHHSNRVQQSFVDRDRVVPFCKRTLLVVYHATSLIENR